MAENTVDSTYNDQPYSSFPFPREFQNATEVTPPDAYSHQLDFTSYDFGPGALLLGSMDVQPLVSQDTLPHSSKGQVAHNRATSDLEEPDYLIKEGGAPNTEKIEEYQGLSEYKFDMNFAESEWRKSHPQIYSKKLNMLLMTPSDGKNESKKLIFWTAKEVRGGRVRIVMLRKDKREKHKPVLLCPTHQHWSHTGHYILSASLNQPKPDGQSIQYYTQEGHPILVVPLKECYKDKHVKTGDDGYSYPGEFYFPCNAFDLKQDSITLVAALEVPSHSNGVMYRCVGVTIVDMRVCGSPGRDKDKREEKLATMKEGTSRKRSTRDSTEMDASDGPPIPKQKKVSVKQSASEAGCTHNGANPLTDEATTGLFTGICPSISAVYAAPAPTVGVTSEEDPTSTVVPVAMETHVCSTNSASNADFNGQLRQVRAIVDASIANLIAARQMLDMLQQASCQSEVQAAETTSGGDSHSHA